MLIYVTSITNRLRYTFDLLINNLIGIDYEFTTDPDKFSFYTGPKFTYSKDCPYLDVHLVVGDDAMDGGRGLQPVHAPPVLADGRRQNEERPHPIGPGHNIFH